MPFNKMFKKIIAIALIFIISANNFAAVVSDNDGSAFITKAEFDSLKNDFQSQIDQYNTSIDNKIDGAIAAYLAGIKVTKTEELINNLQTLQNSYDVYWSGQTTGLVRTRVKYGSSYEIQLGARGNDYTRANARLAQASAEVAGEFVNFPIITKTTLGSTDYYEIQYWEERKPWISYCGFFMANFNDTNSFMNRSINGIFATYGFNPNTNNIFKRQDQWWMLRGSGDMADWAMSIWGTYSTKVQNKDTRSIYIYPNATITYVWNESNTSLSTGEDGGVAVPNVTNSGSWAGTSPEPPTRYTGNLNFVGYTKQTTAYFPWCHIEFNYNALVDSRVTTITGERSQIRYGLLISKGEGPGVLKINANGTASGDIEIRIQNENNTSVIKTLTSTVGTSNTTYTIDLKELESKQKFNIWISYLPSTKQQLYVDSIRFEKDDV